MTEIANPRILISEVLPCNQDQYEQLVKLVCWQSIAAPKDRPELTEAERDAIIWACNEGGVDPGTGMSGVRILKTRRHETEQGAWVKTQPGGSVNLDLAVALAQAMLRLWNNHSTYLNWSFASVDDDEPIGGFSGGEVMFNANGCQWAEALESKYLPSKAGIIEHKRV